MEKWALIRHFERIPDESLREHDISTYRLESLTENEEISEDILVLSDEFSELLK